MYFAYILVSELDKRTYVGFSDNVERRLTQHNAGQVTATKHRRPLRIFHQEEFQTLKEAKTRELWWKSGSGRNELKKLFASKNCNASCARP
ncbi:GIY-YIG nuclease family protein [Candidatus Kaiserbacteria bacterium]|nr:GIY-YIG nuclease family protein [Candidatus Kaiserbacteria bacterium]